MRPFRIILLSIAAMILSATAALAMDACHVKDTVAGGGYSVTGLYDQISTEFSYELPENGVTVLIFYAGDCGNSTAVLRTFANSKWINHPDVYIRAVESRGCDLTTIKNQMKTAAGNKGAQFHPVLAKGQLMKDYFHRVYPGQYTIGYPLVLLISHVGGNPYVRYASMGNQSEETFSAAIETLLSAEEQNRYVTQNGLIYRIDNQSATLVDYTGTLPAYLSIPTSINRIPVQAIEKEVFRGCEELEYVNIFPTTYNIGAYAFADCPNLERVDLGGQQISEGAFSNCPNLQAVQMDDISYIGKNAFKDCANLFAIVEWPNRISNLLIIGESAFSGCKELDFTIPSCVRYIADNAFQNSGITSVTLTDQLWSLGKGAFQDCEQLTQANIQTTLAVLPEQSFSGCSNLQSVTLSSQLTEIGAEAFEDCTNLKSVELPEGLTTLRQSAFANTGLTSVVVPDHITTMETGIFQYCEYLASATLPNHLTELPASLFAGCRRLTDVTLPEGLTALPDSLFSQCESLPSIQIPESVTVIGDATFYLCKKLDAVMLPDRLSSLGDGAFSLCDTLTSIVIPAGVDFVGDRCFDSCDDLKGIYFQGDAPAEFGRNVVNPYQYGISLYYLSGTRGWVESSAYDSETERWNNCPLALWNTVVSGNCGTKGDEASVTWELDMITGAFTISGEGAMADIPYRAYNGRFFVSDWADYRNFIRTVVVEEGVTYVGNGAFYDMPFVTSVVFPASITGLGYQIFEECERFSIAYFCGDAPAYAESNNFNNCAEDFVICYPDGAAGWTSPTWNQWPTAHTLLRNDTLIYNSVYAAPGNRAVLAIYAEDGRFLGFRTARYNSPILNLPLPQDPLTDELRLFCLDESAGPLVGYDLTSLLQTTP